LGQALTLLFAVLLLGGAPVADETGADDEPMVPTETDASVVETESNASPTQGNGSLAAGEADTADPNATATANASTSGEHLSAEADAVEGDVEMKASPIEGTVRVSDRRVVEMTYTPPSAEEAMPEVPQTAPDDENVEETDAEAASTEDEQAGSSEAVWALAPATGLAAAAAVTQTTPVGRWLRRVLSPAPLAPLYSRISSDEVLDHETREAIYELLEREAGLSLEAIADELDLARSTARHHVRKLEETGMIEHARIGRARVHHVVGERKRALHSHLLANETRAEVFEAIEDRPLTITEIAEAIDANPGSVHFHLDKLADRNLVQTTDEEGRRYLATDLAAAPDAVVDPA
jgi:predicted transcriptional regulator